MYFSKPWDVCLYEWSLPNGFATFVTPVGGLPNLGQRAIHFWQTALVYLPDALLAQRQKEIHSPNACAVNLSPYYYQARGYIFGKTFIFFTEMSFILMLTVSNLPISNG